MIAKILEQLSPFCFLTAEEKERIIQSSTSLNYRKGDVIFSLGESEWQYFYVLAAGRVNVAVQNERIGFIEAPSYFGERAIFFEQPRDITVIADTDVKCFAFSGDILIALVKSNSVFRHAFAVIMRDKHKVLSQFNAFRAYLVARTELKFFNVNDFLLLYKNLHPVMHYGASSNDLDFPVLSYVLRTLHFPVTRTCSIILSEDLREFGTIQYVFGPTYKRKFAFQIIPGKVFILLRDDISDFIDIISRLSVYLIETKKISQRLIASADTVKLLTLNYFRKRKSKKLQKKLEEVLPFNDAELPAIKSIFGKEYLMKLYEIIAQQSNMSVQLLPEAIRYYSISSQDWIN
jgi:hypothetical protein